MRELANNFNNATAMIVAAGEEYEKKRILELFPEDVAYAHRTSLIHQHDLEYANKSINCVGLSVGDLVEDKSLSLSQALRVFGRKLVQLTNQQSGGIGIINFDSDLSGFVTDETDDMLVELIREFFIDLNVPYRKGCEKAYITLAFGLDNSVGGRRISFAILKAHNLGDEKGFPFIFPNLVFKLDDNVNAIKGSSNYDVFQMALSETAKTMVPTYMNCSCSLNKSAKPEQISIQGCRSRIVDNIYGDKSSLNRGNLAAVTINLPQLAYKASKSVDNFFNLLSETMEIAKKSLLFRYGLLKKCDINSVFPIKVYKDLDSENIEMAIRNGTLAIGFIGLWDSISILNDINFTDVEQMKPFLPQAVNIVKTMRGLCDKYKEQEKLNFSLLASAAEGVTGKFANYDASKLGKGNLISEKGYYSNGFQIPPTVKCSIFEKIDIESEMHYYCNGGGMTYVELNEVPQRNEEAINDIVEYAMKKDLAYFGVNFPLDYCEDCGYKGTFKTTCPRCDGKRIISLRRVSGYLSPKDRFVSGKKKEEKARTANNLSIKI